MPAISFDSGEDLVVGGTARGEALSKDYIAKRYHQPDDEYSADWDMSGFVADAALLHTVGRNLANSGQWPNWSDDSEFRAARDQTESDRAATRNGERG